MNNSDKKRVWLGAVLWIGLLILGAGMTVWGLMIMAGKAEGTRLCLVLGVLVMLRSLIKLFSLRKLGRGDGGTPGDGDAGRGPSA